MRRLMRKFKLEAAVLLLTFLAIGLVVSSNSSAQYYPPGGGGTGGATGPTGPTGPVAPSGGINTYLVDHTFNSGDCDHYINMDGSNLTLTFASPPISAICPFSVQNLATTPATLARNTTLINKTAADLTLAARSGSVSSGMLCRTDGTDYFCTQGVPGVAGPTGATGVTGSGGSASPPYLTVSAVTYGPIFAVTAPPASSWTWVNQGTSTVTATNTSLEFSFQTNSGTDNLRCYTQPLPASTNYTAIMGVLSLSHAVGVAISDGTKIISLWQNGGGVITGFKFNSATSASGNYFTDISNLGVLGGMLWIRFKDDATHRTTAISADGRNWTPLDSQNTATFLTETTFGICQETNVGGSFAQPAVIVDFRMTTP